MKRNEKEWTRVYDLLSSFISVYRYFVATLLEFDILE